MLFNTRGGRAAADSRERAIQRSEPHNRGPLAPGMGGSTTAGNDGKDAEAVATTVARYSRRRPNSKQGSIRNGVDSPLVNAAIHVRVIAPSNPSAASLFLLRQH
jgi:hypothetical protein